MTADVIAPTLCPKCSAPYATGVRFCEKCGAPLQAGAQAPGSKGRSALGKLTTNSHLKQIKSARWAIALVGIITLGFTIFLHINFNAEVAKLRSNPAMTVNESIVSQQLMLFYANYAIVATFAGLFFWTKKNPFAACLTALIIYLSVIVLNAALDPTTIYKGLLLKIFVIVMLANGVKSGLAYRRLVEKGDLA